MDINNDNINGKINAGQAAVLSTMAIKMVSFPISKLQSEMQTSGKSMCLATNDIINKNRLFGGFGTNVLRTTCPDYIKYKMFFNNRQPNSAKIDNVLLSSAAQSLVRAPLESINQLSMVNGLKLSDPKLWIMTKRSILPSFAISFLYSTVNLLSMDYMIDNTDPFLIGFVSGSLSQGVIYPFDSIWKRQTSTGLSIRNILIKNRADNLFRGYCLSVLKNGFSFSIKYKLMFLLI